MHAKLPQSYPILCDPMDCSWPGSSVHGISQARILESVAISSLRESSQGSNLNLLRFLHRKAVLYHWATRKALVAALFTVTRTWKQPKCPSAKGTDKEYVVCIYNGIFSSVQFSSVTQLCRTLCNPMNCTTPGFPVHHQLPELTQTHVHWVSDAIQPSHPLSSPYPPTVNLSQHQGLFQWVSSLHQVAKVLEL